MESVEEVASTGVATRLDPDEIASQRDHPSLVPVQEPPVGDPRRLDRTVLAKCQSEALLRPEERVSISDSVLERGNRFFAAELGDEGEADLGNHPDEGRT